MKNNILYILISLLVGLGGGYFLFGGNDNPEQIQNHSVETEKQLWTCSMHPQIMKSEPGDCPICGMDLVPFMKRTTEFLVIISVMVLVASVIICPIWRLFRDFCGQGQSV